MANRVSGAAAQVSARGVSKRRLRKAMLATAVTAGALMFPQVSAAHTDALGFVVQADPNNPGKYVVKVYYGTYHGGVTAAEGAVQLKLGQTVVGTQTFLLANGFVNVPDGTLPPGLVLGQNYFYVNPSTNTLVTTPNPVVTAFQYATFSNLDAGTYSFGYQNTTGLSSVWTPYSSVVNAGSFTLTQSGNVGGIGGTPTIPNIVAPASVNDVNTGVTNPVFDGGTVNATTAAGASQSVTPSLTVTNAGGTYNVDGGVTLTQVGAISNASGASGAITKNGAGTLVMNATNSYTGGTTVNAGTLQLGGTNSAPGDVYLRGGQLTLTSGTAVGGTIHAIDPTINFAATGDYADPISLEVASPNQATDPTILNNTSGGAVTISGKIAEGAGATNQYVTFTSNTGTSTTLTNAANSWTGVTTAATNATLIGTSATISGGSISVGGTLSYVQPGSGTVAQAISGGGKVTVAGLSAGNALTFSGAVTNTQGISVADASTVRVTGSLSTGGVSFSSTGGATLNNQGTVSGATGNVSGTVNASAGVTVINGATGNTAASIGGNYAAIYNTGGALNVTNYGAISSNIYTIVAQGGSAANPTSLTLNNAGTIAGAANAVSANDTTTSNSITNSGLIQLGTYNAGSGTVTAGNAGSAVVVRTASAIANTGTGTIVGSTGTTSGDNAGINALGGLVQVTNAGTIVGGYAGIQSVGALQIDNSGRIASGTLSGGVISVSPGAGNESGVLLGDSAVSTVINRAAGTIQGGFTGVLVGSSTGTAAVRIENAGSITGTGTGNGVALFNTGGSGHTILNSGTIEVTGAVAGNDAWGVALYGGGNLIVNSGAIRGDKAIELRGSTTSTIVNGGTLGGLTYAIRASGGTGGLNFTNYGTATGLIGTSSTGVAAIVLMAGSSTGAITTGAAADSLTLYTGTANAAAVTNNGMTVRAAGTFAAPTVGTVNLGTGANTVALRGAGDGQAANGAAGSFTLTGSAGLGTITKLDGGTWTLTGNASGTGIAQINAGTGGTVGTLIFNTTNLAAPISVNGAVIRATVAGGFGTGTITTVDPTVQYAATGTYANNIVLASADPVGDPTRLQADAGVVATLTGTISQGAAGQPLVFDGPGTIILTNAQSYTGGTTISNGRLVERERLLAPGVTTVNSGATLELNFNNFAYFDGATINGAGTIQKTGTGELRNRGLIALTAAGLLDIQAGNFKGSSDEIGRFTGNLGSLNIASGATFDGVEGDIFVDRLTGTGALVGGYFGRGSTTIGVANGTATFDGVIADGPQGPLTLIKTGTGTQTLTSVNTYTGTTTIAGGTLALSGAGSIGNSRAVVDSILDVSGAAAVAGVNTIIKGADFYPAYTGSTAAGVASTLAFQASTYGINGIIAFTDASGTIIDLLRLTSSGTAAVGSPYDNYTFYNVLTADPLIGTTCVTGGSTVCLAAMGTAQDLNPAASTLNGGQGHFNNSGFTATILDTYGDPRVRSLAGSGQVVLGAATLTINNASDTFAGTITGTGRLRLLAGSQTLTNTNSYSGGTTITAGTLTGGVGSFGTGAIVDNGTLAVVQAASGTLSNNVSGSGLVTVSGLSAGNAITFSGALTNAGGLTAGTNGSVTIGATGSVSSASTTGAIQVTGTGDVVTIQSGGSVTSTQTMAGNYASAIYGTASNFTVTNAGTINAPGNTNATFGSNGIYAAGAVTVNNTGRILGVPSGSTATYRGDGVISFGANSIVNNTDAALTGGTLASAPTAGGVITGGWDGVYLTAGGTVFNAGDLAGNFYFGVEGATAVTNYAGGRIVGGSGGLNTGIVASVSNAGLIASGSYNSSTAAVTGGAGGNGVAIGGGSVDNLAGGRIVGGSGTGYGVLSTGGVTLTNAAAGGGARAGQIVGGYTGVEVRGLANLTNNGLIGAGALDPTNTGTTITSGYTAGGTDGIRLIGTAGGTITNNGGAQISSTAGSGIYVEGGATASTTSIFNSGLITSANGVYTFGSSINGNQPVALIVTNNTGGTITGSSGYGVNNGGGALTLDNYGTISGTTGAIRAVGNGTALVTLRAGSITTGSTVLGSGDDTLTIYNGSGATAGAALGAIDGGAGNDTLVLRGVGDGTAAGAAGSFNLANGVGFDILRKRDSGTWTLNGAASNALRVATIYAGDGPAAGNGGLLIFNGTTGLTGGIYVNGAVIRSAATGSFGTGTIHLVDPTVQFAATQTSANNYSLEVASPASADPSVFQTTGAYTVTLTGAITTGTGNNINGAAIDPVQYVTFDGTAGSLFQLTNTANSWTGVTRINSGITLQGTTLTISGGSVTDTGVLAFNQNFGGTFAKNITGAGSVTVAGLGANTILFSGNNAVTGGVTLVDSGRVRFSGTNTSTANGVTANGLNTAVTVDAGATLISTVADAARFQGGAGAVSTFTNSGTTGSVTADAGNAVTVTNNSGGLIQRTFTGSAIDSQGGQLTVINQANADIVGLSFGIIGRNAADSVDNSGRLGVGTLAGGVGSALTLNGGSPAVGLFNGGTLTNRQGGLITTSSTTVQIGGANGVVTNSGTITGGTADGFYRGVWMSGTGAQVTNTATGVITGSRGVQFSNAGTFTNFGSVTNTFAANGTNAGQTNAVSFFNGGTLDNRLGATVDGNGHIAVIFIGAAPSTSTNAGTIMGSSGFEIYSTGANQVTNTSTGLITGTDVGVYANTSTTVSNAGTIRGAGAPYGAVNGAGGTLTVANSGVLQGTAGAAVIGNAGTGLVLSNTTSGQIVGTVGAVAMNGATASISNAGLIGVGTLSGGAYTAGGSGDAISMLAGGLTNTGTLNGANRGVAVTTGTATLTNTGTILGRGDDGITAFGGTTLLNSGSVRSAVNSGIAIGNTATATITNAVAGMLTGGSDATYGYGVQSNTTGLVTVNNYGAATGSQGGIVSLNTGAMAINLFAGSTTGAIALGAANDTLSLYTGNNNATAVTTTYTDAVSGAVGTVVLQNAGANAAAQVGAVNLGGGSNTLNLNGAGDGTTANGAAGFLTNGAVLGATTIAKNGTGTWTISGTANADTTTVNVNAGLLNVTGGNAIADTAVVNVFAGGTLGLLANETVAALNGGGNVALGANTLTLAGTGDSLFTGVASGTGGLTKLGVGTLTLTGQNSFTGTLLIQGGTVAYGANNVLANTATVTVLAGTTFNLNGFADTIGTLNLYGTLANGGALTATNYNAYAGSTIGQMIATGTLNVYGNTQQTAASLADPINIYAGTLTTTGAEFLADTARVNIAAAGTLAIGGTETIGSLADLPGGGGTVQLGANTLIVAGAASTSFSGVITGAGGLTRSGTGTLTLTGVNTFTGPTTINGGILAVGGGNALTDGNAVTVNAGGTLQLIANERVGTLTGAGNVALGANTLLLGTNSGSSTFNGVASGTGGITQTGTGTLTLSGANTFTGTTLVDGGNFVLGASNALADASTLTIQNGTGSIGANSDTVAALNLTAAVLTGSTGTLTAGRYTLVNGTLSALTGAGTLVAATGNTLSTINRASGATIVEVDAGTLRLGAADLLSDAATVYALTGSTFDLGANNDTVAALVATNSIVAGTGTLTAGSYLLTGATVNANLGAGDMLVLHDTAAPAGSSTVTRLNGTAGATAVQVSSLATLQLGAADRLADTAAVAVSPNGILDLGAFNDTVGSLSLAGALNGTGTLTAATYGLIGATVNANLGAGTLTQVSGTSTLFGTAGAGTVAVQGGTLALGAANRLADNAAVTVASGSILDLRTFSDTVGTVALNGTLNGTGTLTAATYTLNGATVNAKLGTGTLTQAGGTSVLNGTAAAANVAINAGTLRLGASERLADNAGLILATGATLDLAAFNETVSTAQLNGTLAGTGTLTAGTYYLDGATVNANLGGGSLVQNGATSTLNGSAAAGVVTVQAGTLALGAAERLANNADLVIEGGATFDLTDHDETVGTATVRGTLDSTPNRTGTLTAGSYTLDGGLGFATYSPLVNGNLGAGTMTVQGKGVATLNGTAGAGTVAIVGGHLLLGADERLADTAAVTITGPGAGASGPASLDVGTHVETVGSLQINNGVLDGTGTLKAATYGLTDAVINANLGAGILTQQAGSSTLNGTAGAGTVNVEGGTLLLGASDRLANNAAVAVSSGASLNIGGFTDTVGTLALNGTLDGTGTLTATSYTLNGGTANANLGTGTLTNAGGNSTLNGTSAATTVAVNAGTLNLGAANRLADTAAVSVAAGATLNIATYTDTVGSLTLGGTLNGTGTLTAATYTLTGGTANANLGTGALIQASGASTLNGSSAASSLTVNGGSLLLNGTAAATTVTVNTGSLVLGASNRLADNAVVTVGTGALFNLNGFTETIGTLNLYGTLGNGGGLTASVYNSYAGATIGRAITTGTLNVYGDTLLTYTTAVDPVNVFGGTLTLGASNLLADTAAVTVASGATLDLGAFSDTVGTLALNGTLNGTGTLTAASYTLNGGTANANLGTGTLVNVGGASTLNGSSAASSLTVTGGSLLVNGTAAATTVGVNAGTLALGANNRLADAAAVTVANGAVLDLKAFSDTVGTLALNGTLNGTGTLTAATYTLGGATVNGNLGAGTLTQAGGTSVLTGSSAAATVNVNAGTLALGAANRLADNAAVTVASGSILDLRTFSDTVGTVALNGTLNGTGTLTATSYTLNNAAVNGNLGAGTLTQAGGASVLTGSSAAATVNVNAGTLRLAADERLLDTGAVTVATGATFDVNGRTETVASVNGGGTVALGAGRLVLAGTGASSLTALTGTGNLDKTGTGTLTLASNYAATGSINLSAGTTTFTGTSAGSFRVSGGTLTGTGTAAGTLTMTGGTVSPGVASATNGTQFGVLTVGGLAASGGTYALDFGGAATGYASDLIRVNGTAALSGTLTVAPTSFAGNERFQQLYTVIQANSVTGTFANGGSFSAVTNDPTLFYRLRYDLVPNAVVLQVQRQVDFTLGVSNLSPNQRAVAVALNGGAGLASDSFAATLNAIAGSSLGTRNATYDSLSGEVIADVTTTALFASDRFVDLLRSRMGLRHGGAAAAGAYALRAGSSDGQQHANGFAGAMQDGINANGGTADAAGTGERSVGVWLQGYGAGRRLEGRVGSGQATTNSFVDGLAGGVDAQLGAVTLGVAGGFSDVETKLRGRNSRLEGTLYQVGGYVGFDLGSVYGSVAGDYYDGDVDITRQLQIGGSGIGQARGTTNVHGYSIGGTLGGRFAVGNGTFAGVELTGQQTGATRRGYSETAPLGLGLIAARDSRDVFTGTAQVKLSHLFTGNGWTAEPYASGGVQVNRGDLDTINAMRFSGAPTGTGSFLVTGTRLERTLGVFSGGVEIRPSDKFRIDVSAGGAVGQRTHEGQVKVSARLGF